MICLKELHWHGPRQNPPPRQPADAFAQSPRRCGAGVGRDLFEGYWPAFLSGLWALAVGNWRLCGERAEMARARRQVGREHHHSRGEKGLISARGEFKKVTDDLFARIDHEDLAKAGPSWCPAGSGKGSYSACRKPSAPLPAACRGNKKGDL